MQTVLSEQVASHLYKSATISNGIFTYTSAAYYLLFTALLLLPQFRVEKPGKKIEREDWVVPGCKFP
jgi:hypothetical protein